MAIASGNLGVTRAGLYVLITNQADFSQYVSNIPCDSAGNYTVIGDRGFEMPAGTYNISTGPSSRGPWSVTGSTVVATEIIPGPLVAQSLTIGSNSSDFPAGATNILTAGTSSLVYDKGGAVVNVAGPKY